jgi:hypothetical protein
MPMEFTTPNRHFNVISHGNGWAYEVTCNRQPFLGETLWFQDADAEALHMDTNGFNDESALIDRFELLLTD